MFYGRIYRRRVWIRLDRFDCFDCFDCFRVRFLETRPPNPNQLFGLGGTTLGTNVVPGVALINVLFLAALLTINASFIFGRNDRFCTATFE